MQTTILNMPTTQSQIEDGIEQAIARAFARGKESAEVRPSYYLCVADNIWVSDEDKRCCLSLIVNQIYKHCNVGRNFYLWRVPGFVGDEPCLRGNTPLVPGATFIYSKFCPRKVEDLEAAIAEYRGGSKCE